MSEPNPGGRPTHGQLSLWDTVSIIVGIVIGSSIFTIPTIIFIRVGSPWEVLSVWAFCGVLSFIGALCYAELATTYPRYGGDYVYLTRGLDRPMGFLFGWAQLAVVLSASTGSMAFIFGEYLAALLEIQGEHEKTIFAAQAGVGAVIGLTLLNFFGVVLSKWIQNALVLVKLVGLALIVIAAFIAPAENAFEVTNSTRGQSGIPGAMILVLYAFGGWNDAAFVAADLRERRNITKALLLSTVGITVIYLLVNFAYIYGIGFEAGRQFRFTMPRDILTNAFSKLGGAEFGVRGGQLISIIVMTSALGAMNGLIYTGSRVYLPLGKEHRVFAILGYWNKTLRAPLIALVAQALVTIGLILAVGTPEGREAIDQGLTAIRINKIPWAEHFGGFNTLFDGSAPVFWIFFLLTGLSMFALRARDPNVERPFMLKPPFYPLLPIIFCGMCLFGFWSAMTMAGWLSLLGFIPLFLGFPLYWLSGKGLDTAESSYSLAPSDEDRIS
jgi:basic amino acid/polyamine antiporter, APA family